MRHFFHDGDTVTLSDDYLFSQEDWIIDYDRNENNEILNSSGSKVLKFVGIIINQDNQDVVISFPKKYRVTDIEKDTELILQVLIKDYSENIGEKQVESNYPFASFFYVYDFFKDYGLIYTNKVFNKANVGGKINWDYTIKNSMKFISNGSLIHIPLYFKKKHPFSDFLTECIIYCIDYTLDKFQMIIKLEKTGHKFPEYNFFQDKKYVLDRLYSIRNNTFSDLMLNLIDELIKFFSTFDAQGNIYIKNHYFSSVWEKMVEKYLTVNFESYNVASNSLEFKKNIHKVEFKKEVFRPNERNENNSFSPDHYYFSNNKQYIFDAKYYNNFKGIDYKQISYLAFLYNYRHHEGQISPSFEKTYSALILPGEKRNHKVHFKMKPKYNKEMKNIIIVEEYLDIKEVIKCYLNKDFSIQ